MADSWWGEEAWSEVLGAAAEFAPEDWIHEALFEETGLSLHAEEPLLECGLVYALCSRPGDTGEPMVEEFARGPGAALRGEQAHALAAMRRTRAALWQVAEVLEDGGALLLDPWLGDALRVEAPGAEPYELGALIYAPLAPRGDHWVMVTIGLAPPVEADLALADYLATVQMLCTEAGVDERLAGGCALPVVLAALTGADEWWDDQEDECDFYGTKWQVLDKAAAIAALDAHPDVARAMGVKWQWFEGCDRT
jgi:hypothetical protein